MPREGFNANQRAAERESGPIVIGDATYHPARLTNKRLRAVRSHARKAGLEAEKAAKESSEYKETYDAAIADGAEEKDAVRQATEAGAGSEVVADINMASLLEQLPLLLVDDSQQPPTKPVMKRHLEDDLDARDVEALMGYLLGPEDPTPEATTTTTP